MALEATYIRFALDLKEDVRAQDVEKYVSGAIYPDSRYVTGVDRAATHKEEDEGGWIKFTAIKILCDIDDLGKFDLREYLACLNYVDTPNGENRKHVSAYNRIFQDMYSGKRAGTIESAYAMWKAMGIGEEFALKVKIQTEEYSKNDEIVKAIPGIYPEAMKRARGFIATKLK